MGVGSKDTGGTNIDNRHSRVQVFEHDSTPTLWIGQHIFLCIPSGAVEISRYRQMN